MRATAAERYEDVTDWEWEINCSADAKARVKRLETAKLSRFELYEELLELTALLEVYWRGQTEERQQATAREVRDVLRRCEALKERMRVWARKEIARRVPIITRRIGDDVPNTLGDAEKEMRKDFRARHPKQGIF